MQSKIYQAKLAQAKEIAAVHLASWNRAYEGIYPEWYIEERPFTYRHGMWIAYLQDDQRPVFVAEINSEIRGFVRFGRPDNLAATDPDVGEVHQLYIDPQSQNHGLGSQLLRHAEGELQVRGYKRAVLDVTVGKAMSLQFYGGHGWKISGHEFKVDFGGFEIPLQRLNKTF